MSAGRAGCALACALPGIAGAQAVEECSPALPVTALIEPWEETAASLAEGAVRLAVLEGGQGTRRLLVLTLPPPAEAPDAVSGSPPERRCRIVAEDGLGFADLDLGGREASEANGVLTVRVPALGFVPESTELRPLTLVLALGAADGSLAVTVEEGGGAP